MDNTENRIIDLMAVLKESLAAKKPAGEPTQAGEHSLPVEEEGSSPVTGVAASPASPAEEVERLAGLLHKLHDVDTQATLWDRQHRQEDVATPSLYYFRADAEWLLAHGVSVRAPSSAPRVPSAEAVEAAYDVAERANGELLRVLRAYYIDHPRGRT